MSRQPEEPFLAGRHFSVITFGFRKLYGVFKCREPVVRRVSAYQGNMPNEQEVMDALSMCGWNPALSLCALDFHDPAATADKSHVGTNARIIHSILRHEDRLDAVLTSVQDFLEQLSPEEARSRDAAPVLATWCKSGRHRSVALATILQHCLEACGATVELVHLMEWYWRHPQCGMCRECRIDLPDDERASALDRALGRWWDLWGRRERADTEA